MSFSADYFSQRHLLGLEGLSRPALLYLLALVQEAANDPQGFGRASRLAGLRLIGLFIDAAPEVQSAFEQAARRLGAEVVFAQIPKPDATLSEIAAEVAALQPAIVVLRSPEAGFAKLVARKLDCGVVNAGDGAHEDPVVALNVAATIFRARGAVDGLTVAICGDALHSGAARSLLILLTCLGARVRMVGPSIPTPPAIGRLGVEVCSDMRAGLTEADVAIVLPLASQGDFVASRREYFHSYGLDEEKLAFARPDTLVLQAGLLVRGVEISADVADGTRSLILRQAELAVPARMAVLEALARNMK
jgi:aspartate carbamoyltransferase catalytic subunit